MEQNSMNTNSIGASPTGNKSGKNGAYQNTSKGNSNSDRQNADHSSKPEASASSMAASDNSGFKTLGDALERAGDRIEHLGDQSEKDLLKNLSFESIESRVQEMIRKRPIAAFCGAVAAGLLANYLFSTSTTKSDQPTKQKDA